MRSVTRLGAVIGRAGFRRAWRRWIGGASVLLLSACAIAPATGGGGSDDAAHAMVPPGHGTLRQDEISVDLRRGELQVKVTPLEEWMIRLAAPDTYRRLSEIATRHRPALAREAGVAAPTLFLVSVFTDGLQVPYDPEDLGILNRGRRYRPLAIRPVTAEWGTQRLDQQEVRTAVYAFSPVVDLDLGTVFEYGDVRSRAWDGILQRLESEHARVRARAGSRPSRPFGGAGAPLHSSSP